MTSNHLIHPLDDPSDKLNLKVNTQLLFAVVVGEWFQVFIKISIYPTAEMSWGAGDEWGEAFRFLFQYTLSTGVNRRTTILWNIANGFNPIRG